MTICNEKVMFYRKLDYALVDSIKIIQHKIFMHYTCTCIDMISFQGMVKYIALEKRMVQFLVVDQKIATP